MRGHYYDLYLGRQSSFGGQTQNTTIDRPSRAYESYTSAISAALAAMAATQ